MDAKLEQMLIGELQPVVKFKRFEYTPMTDEDKEAMSKYIANPREYYRRKGDWRVFSRHWHCIC
jgi:hypothetical protein